MKWQEMPGTERRLFWIRRLTAGAFVVLFLGLWRIQVIRADHFQRLAENNSIRVKDIPPLRGIFFDRRHRVLADRVLMFNLWFDREKCTDAENSLHALARIGIDESVLGKRLARYKDIPKRKPALLAENISFSQMAYVSARALEHPEWHVETEARRRYPFGILFSHALGYLGEISKPQMMSHRYRDAESGDMVGQAGLEYTYDNTLRGKHGTQRAVVNSLGRELSLLDKKDAVPGNDLFSTLDVKLGLVIEKAFGGKSGAAVVLNPKTGAVLALSSFPEFDPTAFVLRFDRRAWERLSHDPRHPLQNRAVSGLYSPGSTFKPVAAVAGLEEGVITPSTRFFCGGKAWFYGTPFSCWKPEGHGWITLHNAIVHSCNIYFYNLGRLLGIERLASYAEQFGFDHPTGLDLPGEKTGTVPSPAWKRSRFGQQWYDGETISVAIGQGALRITPLEQAVTFSALANGGHVMRPYLVSELRDPKSGKILERTQPQILRTVEGADSTWTFLREALWSGVNENGSGWRARVAGFDVCGKTGTAQVVSTKGKDFDEEEVKEALLPHAWFAGFAPVDDPKIVVVVLVEHGGYGGEAAAPIARQIFENFLEEERDAPQ